MEKTPLKELLPENVQLHACTENDNTQAKELQETVNEDALRQTLLTSEDSVINAQIEKSNQEMQLMREQHESEIHKLSAIIRHLEIKNASLGDLLDVKKKECSALAALYDEVTGKVTS